MKLDIIDFYPLVKVSIIKKAVAFYSKGINDEDDIRRIEAAFELVFFSMRSCIVTFNSKYFEFGRVEDYDNKGLPIGGYASAFFADLIATYIFTNTTNLICNNADF